MTDTSEEHDDNPNGVKPIYRLKCVVVGDLGVGKTTLVRSFAEGPRTRSITAEPKSMWQKEIKMASYIVSLSIWDTAGQERYRSLTGSYYRGAHCCIVVFDVNCLDSFQNVEEWFQNIDENSTNPEEIIKILVGTKRGSSSRAVSLERAESLADHLGVSYKEVNFGSQNNIRELFESLADLTVLVYKENNFHSNIPVELPQYQQKKTYCSCG